MQDKGLKHYLSYLIYISQVSEGYRTPRLEGSAIKRRDKEHALAEAEKTHRKSGSEKHAKKNRVIYKRKAQ